MNFDRNRKSELTLMCFAIMIVLPLFCSCASEPVKEQTAKVVIYNNSQELWFGRDNSGRVKIYIDDEKVCNLNRGQYVTIEMVPGIHTVDLNHKDFLRFDSRHTIFVNGYAINYLQVNATPAANMAEMTIRPNNFEKLYTAAAID
jgi:hypothetical protein